MRIFITGASGFVGGAIARRLSPDHEVYAMARSANSAEKVRQNGAIPVACDLDSVTAEHLQSMDAVIHAAAFVEPWGSRRDFWKGNVEGTERMLAAARTAEVPRFIHIGTEAALFDGTDLNNVNEHHPYPQKTPFLYSETKKEAEMRVLGANVPGIFETISLRPRLVWGPGDTTILANLVELVDGGKFRWLDGGSARTSTCYIENIAFATQLALGRGRGGEAYFITDGEEFAFKDFITRLLKTVGRDPGQKSISGKLARGIASIVEFVWKTLRIKKKPPITRFAAAIVSRNVTLDISKARAELAYHPLVSPREGFKRMAKTAASS